MARPKLLSTVLLCITLLPISLALKFDLAAHTGHSARYERCIRNFVAKETLVLVTAIVSGDKGDGQMVNMHVSSQAWEPFKRGRAIRPNADASCPLDQRCSW